MKLIPVVMSFPGQPPTTDAQLAAAKQLCLNTSAAYQRMTGKSFWVQLAPLALENTLAPAPSMSRDESQRVAWDNRDLFNSARDTLSSNGYDPATDVYAVWLRGNSLDGSGRGGSWTNGWMTDPTKGGVAVMGEMRLLTAMTESPDPRTGYYRVSDPPSKYDPAAQARYAVWLAVHEVGHALGLSHTGEDPLNGVFMRQSVMAYGRHGWVLGEHAHHVGLMPDEIDWLRDHEMFEDSPHARMKNLDPEEVRRVLANEIPARLGLGPGITVEEFT